MRERAGGEVMVWMEWRMSREVVGVRILWREEVMEVRIVVSMPGVEVSIVILNGWILNSYAYSQSCRSSHLSALFRRLHIIEPLLLLQHSC